MKMLGQFMTQRSKSCDVQHEFIGALGRIRTPDPLIRSQVLYPTELPAHFLGAM